MKPSSNESVIQVITKAPCVTSPDREGYVAGNQDCLASVEVGGSCSMNIGRKCEPLRNVGPFQTALEVLLTPLGSSCCLSAQACTSASHSMLPSSPANATITCSNCAQRFRAFRFLNGPRHKLISTPHHKVRVQCARAHILQAAISYLGKSHQW